MYMHVPMQLSVWVRFVGRCLGAGGCWLWLVQTGVLRESQCGVRGMLDESGIGKWSTTAGLIGLSTSTII